MNFSEFIVAKKISERQSLIFESGSAKWLSATIAKWIFDKSAFLSSVRAACWAVAETAAANMNIANAALKVFRAILNVLSFIDILQ